MSVEKNSNEGRPVARRHSIFGDYILVDKKSPSADELSKAQVEIADYNALWRKYTNETSGKWGSMLTKKGFAKWLQQQVEEVSSGK